MHLPKQAAPIQRILAPTAISSEQGIEPSLSMKDIDDFLTGVRKGQEIVKTVLLDPIKPTVEGLSPLLGLFGL